MVTSGGNKRIYEKNSLLLSSVRRCRCGFQGLSDASLHYGWVKSVRDNILRIEVISKKPINSGEFFYFELHTSCSILTFVAFVLDVDESGVNFQITSDVEERRTPTEARLRLTGIGGLMNIDSVDVEYMIEDVSPSGFGFSTSEGVTVTDNVKFITDTLHGAINFRGSVRHSWRDRESDMYRGGVLITEMDRISRVRWSRLLEE